MNKDDKIFVAGSGGMVGSAIIRNLIANDYENLITGSHADLDLTRRKRVERFFHAKRPDIVIDCAAKVGGIHANNTYRADFMYSNLQIQNNLIHTSYEFDVKKLLFLGSSCIYPKLAGRDPLGGFQPIKEESLLSSPLEPTNEPYAVSKIAGVKMCESYHRQYECNFFSIMPCNQYGPNDNFHPENSHVLPALLRKFHEAYVYNYKNVKVWGTGKARREFMHVDDLADACVFLLQNVNAADIYGQGVSHLNVGTGEEISIHDLSHKIARLTKYDQSIEFDLDKPDGTMRKLMDVSRLHDFGWEHKTDLDKGLNMTYSWYKDSAKQ